MDIKSPEERSRNMATIRSKDTRTGDIFQKITFCTGIQI